MGCSQSLNWASNKKVQQVYVKGSVESPIQKVQKFSVVACLEVLPNTKGFFLILFLCTKTLLEIECITIKDTWCDHLRARTEVQTLDYEVLQVCCDLFKISKSQVKKSHQVSAILSMPIKLISGFSFF
jgi:2-polyprenyl-3-methyl-5-hydroxy-6-metoxy-1,4-benzoquinol methylase